MDMFQCISARSNELSLHGYCSNYSNTTTNNSTNHEEELTMMSILAMCNYDTSASLGYFLPEEVQEDDPLITATQSDANPLSSTCKEEQAEENEVDEEDCRGEKEEEEVEERKEKEEHKREEGMRQTEEYREGTRRKRKIVKISEKEEVDEEYKREKEEEEGKVKDEYEEGKRRKRKRVKISKDPQSVVARNRRHRISQNMRILQKLVPGGMKLDTASMLDEAVQYLKHLKAQVRSMEAFMNALENAEHIPFPFPMPIMSMPMEYYY